MKPDRRISGMILGDVTGLKECFSRVSLSRSVEGTRMAVSDAGTGCQFQDWQREPRRMDDTPDEHGGHLKR